MFEENSKSLILSFFQNQNQSPQAGIILILYHTQHCHQGEFGLPEGLDLFRILDGL